MKTFKKIGLLGVLATACAFNPLNTQALSTTMPDAVDGKITLTDDVETSWWTNKGNVTLDLNGHTLKRSGDGYLINNSTKDAVLKIVDSSNGQGSIVCGQEPTGTSSCVRNNGTLEIDGVKNFESYYHGLKNEEESVMTVKNSNIKATSLIASGIQNFGTLTVEDSYVEGAKDPEGAAIFSLTWNDTANNKVYSSSVTVKNSKLVAYWPVIIQQSDSSVPLAADEKVVVNIEDSELIQDGGLARIQSEMVRSTNKAFTLTLKGNITASSDAIEYLEDGSTLKLNKNVTEEITVYDGMTLVIPDGIEVALDGKINFEKGAIIENRSGKDIEVYTVLDGEETSVMVPAGTAIGKVETPVEPENPDDTEEPTDPIDPTDPIVPEVPENPSEPENNPQTFDGVTIYAGLAVISVAGLGLVLKKHLN